MQKNLTCIICPRGCALEVTITDNDISVKGQGCQRGKTYAIDECTHPVRTVTSSVRVDNYKNTMVSVRTATPIPKEEIFNLMKLIRNTTVKAPVHIGDVIIPNVFGTDIIATKEIL